MKYKQEKVWMFPEFFKLAVSTDPDVDMKTRGYGILSGLIMMVIEPIIRIGNKIDLP